ncbi:hypothetical protein DM860_012183 [Cuscuta australis]|uniref:Uncharacterized protein n=1 Tax=Cuscuta australis TaxID=267555 RepID=A0A328EA78_9ASTE|nr:hypothetical protein DM860_012183 [Cuscuta australis]
MCPGDEAPPTYNVALPKLGLLGDGGRPLPRRLLDVTVVVNPRRRREETLQLWLGLASEWRRLPPVCRGGGGENHESKKTEVD